MFKLSNQVLDAYDDTQRVYLKKFAQIDSKINMMTVEERERLLDEDFALSVITKKASKLNKFPINNHDSTWLSNQYFEETHQRMPKTAAHTAAYFIKKSCEKHSVELTPSVAALAKEASSNVYCEEDIPRSAQVVTPRKLDMTKFAQVENICDNYTFAQYAFATPAHISLACKYFDKYASQLPLEWRHKYAAAIQKRAQELGLGQQKGTVVKYASSFYSGHVNAHLSARKTLLEMADPKFTDALSKLAAMKDTMEPAQFAQVLHGFDKRAGLSKYYDGFLTDPYRSTFAQEPSMTKVASDSKLSPDEVSKVASEKYGKIKEYFGKNVADELKKHGSMIFESMPMDAKEIIAGIADGSV